MMDTSRRESVGDGRNDDDEIVEWYKCHGKKQNDNVLIATHLQSQTEVASHLRIQLPGSKLKSKTEIEHSIGGTYNRNKQEFWFFCSTSLCHGNNYLLQVFVIPRRDMRFSLHLPKVGHNLTNCINVHQAENYSEITGPMKEYIFTSSMKDEVTFVKAFRFTKQEIEILEDKFLLIPCSIKIHLSYQINPDIVNRIKLQYTVLLNEALYKSKNEGDFIIESATGTKYPVHLLAAAHSPVFRKAIKDNKKTVSLNLNDKDVEMLVAFLYKGSVENLSSENAPKILEIAVMLGLGGLLQLGQVALSTDINENNAIELAIIAKKYNLKELSLKVFHFIKQNPELLLSSNIEKLNDIDLMRAMLQHVGNPCHCVQKIVH